MGLGVAAGLAPVSTTWRIRIVSGEVRALAAWLGLALLGHAHKVVPFIVWTKLRIDGRMPTGGKPLLFGDLFRKRAAQVTDRKRVVTGKRGSDRVDLGGRRVIKTKKKNETT